MVLQGIVFAKCPPVHYIKWRLQRQYIRPSVIHKTTNHRTVNATLGSSPSAFMAVCCQTELESGSSQITVWKEFLKPPKLIWTELISAVTVRDGRVAIEVLCGIIQTRLKGQTSPPCPNSIGIGLSLSVCINLLKCYYLFIYFLSKLLNNLSNCNVMQ